MEKLIGHGRPTQYTAGQLGQYYEDIDTGNVYECRQSSKYSPVHGAPVGGYIWKLRASGEDIREHIDFYGDGGGSGGGNDGVMIDPVTLKKYRLHVYNGALTMTEVTSE